MNFAFLLTGIFFSVITLAAVILFIFFKKTYLLMIAVVSGLIAFYGYWRLFGLPIPKLIDNITSLIFLVVGLSVIAFTFIRVMVKSYDKKNNKKRNRNSKD